MNSAGNIARLLTEVLPAAAIVKRIGGRRQRTPHRPMSTRTPRSCKPRRQLDALADFPFEPRYLDVDGLRMHYVDEGPPDGPVALIVPRHADVDYLYRKVIDDTRRRLPVHRADQHRLRPQDKVTDPSWYDSYPPHRQPRPRYVQSLDLHDITLFVQIRVDHYRSPRRSILAVPNSCSAARDHERLAAPQRLRVTAPPSELRRAEAARRTLFRDNVPASSATGRA